jgi:hypothetical protein
MNFKVCWPLDKRIAGLTLQIVVSASHPQAARTDRTAAGYVTGQGTADVDQGQILADLEDYGRGKPGIDRLLGDRFELTIPVKGRVEVDRTRRDTGEGDSRVLC